MNSKAQNTSSQDDSKSVSASENPSTQDGSQSSGGTIQDESRDFEALKKDLSEMTETAKRAMADLQNFKRRMEEEKTEWVIWSNKRLLEAIFPALDNFARANETLPEDLKNHEWVKGIQIIENTLILALKNLGLEIIDELGATFDPHCHEVLMEGEGQKNTIVQIFEKGYKFGGKTLRPAKVMVGNKE